MQIYKLTIGSLQENAYILSDEHSAAVIDPGAEYEKIKAAMGDKPCVAVLLTHAHYDHIGAAARFQKEGAKIYLHRDDVKLLSGHGNLSALFGETLDSFVPDVILEGGETLDICGEKIKVISTPGHTEGSVCYIAGDTVFSGDTLFYMSVGRTDFPSGSSLKLHDSIKNKLFKLPSEYKILPGHGESTVLGFEIENNPYV